MIDRGRSSSGPGQSPVSEEAAPCHSARNAVEQIEHDYPQSPHVALSAAVEKACRAGFPQAPASAPSAPERSPGCEPTASEASALAISHRPVARPERAVPFFAARAGTLPNDGPATVAGISLPAGSRCPRYWATDTGVPDALGLASRLAAAFAKTGLWPVIWDQSESPDRYSMSFGDPRLAARLDAGAVLRKAWRPYATPSRRFLGLAAGEGATAPADPFAALAASHTLGSSPDAGLVLILVAVHRPADVISTLDVIQSEWLSEDAITAVARSWEERFGAVLTSATPGGMGLAVGDPPRSSHQALTLAAEQEALAPEDGEGSRSEVATHLLSATTGYRTRTFWTFGWSD